MNTEELEKQLTAPTVVAPRNEMVVVEWIEKKRLIATLDGAQIEGHFKVVSIGPGRITEEGKRIPIEYLAIGDQVMLQGPGQAFEANGTKFMLVPANMCWAVYTGEVSAPS